MIDLIFDDFSKGKPNWILYVRISFFLLNLGILLFGLFGLFGIIIDNGINFSVVNTSMFFSGYPLSKNLLALSITANLIVPIMYYTGAPNQKAMQAMRFAHGKGDKQNA